MIRFKGMIRTGPLNPTPNPNTRTIPALTHARLDYVMLVGMMRCFSDRWFTHVMSCHRVKISNKLTQISALMSTIMIHSSVSLLRFCRTSRKYLTLS